MQTLPKDNDRTSRFFLIVANLVPVAGVLFFSWDITFIVLLYWIENLIAGFYNILKMALLRSEQTQGAMQKFFIIPFFCIHYGGFCAVHGLFLSVFFKIGADPSPMGDSMWWGPLVFIQLLFAVVANLWANRPPGMVWALLGLLISHGVSFFENYIFGEESDRLTLKELMHKPYQRIIVMHLAILAGGIFILQLNSPTPLLLVLIGLKIFFDLRLHGKTHDTQQPEKKENRDSLQDSSS